MALFLKGDFLMTYIAYFDGACEPVNPGGTASYGAAIYENQQLV